MRVLQLIDSLRPGGAEKMAVNIANALLPHVEGSYLCCTRQEGMLKEEIKPEVGFLFLNKKSSFDPKAILKLRKYIKKNKIDIVHAHSTSYFLAGLLKLSGCKFKFIWHNHFGASENWKGREFKVLKIFSRHFTGIITVNTALKEWAIKNLNCKNVIEIKNFIPKSDFSTGAILQLKGNKDDFKIICVANLRPEKDHFNLLRAFGRIDPGMGVTLHLIGENPRTTYSESVLKAINNSPAKNKIFYYGSQPGIISLLKQADVGVLSSRSEGLPMALLEYGMAGLPVVCTNVGKCAKVLGEHGIVVDREDSHSLVEALYFYIKDPKMRANHAACFNAEVEQNYTVNAALYKIIEFYTLVKN